MGLVIDIFAAPRPTAARDSSTAIRQPSSPRRRDGFLHSLRRLAFRGSLDAPLLVPPSEPRMSERDALKALARVNAAVQVGFRGCAPPASSPSPALSSAVHAARACGNP